jgi:hypothetical protein
LRQNVHLFTFGDYCKGLSISLITLISLMFPDTDTGFQPTGSLAGPNNPNPLGNPNFPGFTSSGGENWVGFICHHEHSVPTLVIRLDF